MPASDLAGLAGFPVGGLLVLDIALHDVEGCSTGGDDGVGRGPEVIAPQCLFDLGPVVGPYPHRGDGLQRHHQPGQGHFRWVGHEQVGVVLVALERFQGGVEPAADFLERGFQVRCHALGHHFPAVLRGQHDMRMKPVDHMPSVAPIITHTSHYTPVRPPC